MSEQFRTCPDTGLKLYQSTENLIKANAVAAVVFLLVGGIYGLLVGLTRWPAVHLLPADWFYLSLTAHGINVLIFWLIFFEMAILIFFPFFWFYTRSRFCLSILQVWNQEEWVIFYRND